MAGARGIRAGRAYVELFADNSKLIRGLRAAAARLKAFGATVSAVGLRLMGLGAAALGPMALAAKAFSSMGDEAAKMAKRTGVSVQALSELRYVASQTGTNFGTVENAFRKMQRSIYDAGRGLSTQVDAFADLGLKFEHLDGLAPEKQFKIIAEQMSKIEDPTRRAGIAMSLLGRTGTNLLPMMAKGAAGIEALQQEARALGLTMGGKDAKAAEEFTDQMDRLWKVIKMSAFQVGAALAPTIGELAEKITATVVKVNAWIRQNREMIVLAMKMAGAVLAGGIAFMVLGKAIGLLGAALGGVKMILTGVGAAFGILQAAIGLILSPIGLVIAAMAALGGYLLYSTGKGGEAIDWLKRKFGTLADEAGDAWEGISAALATGDIGQAAKILWLTLKLWWKKGTRWLYGIWLDFKHAFIRLGHATFTEFAKVVEVIWHGLEVAWIETTAFFTKAWYWFVNEFQKSWIRMKVGAKAAWAYIRSLFDEDIDLEAELKRIGTEGLAELNKSEDETSRKMAAREAERQKQRKESRELHEATLAAFDRKHAKKLRDLEKERASSDAESQAEIDKARAEWATAIAAAKDKKAAKDAAGPDQMEGPEGWLTDMKDYLAGLGGQMGELKSSVVGTFNAAALDLLGGGDYAGRTAVATEATSKNTRRLLDEARTNQAVFGS